MKKIYLLLVAILSFAMSGFSQNVEVSTGGPATNYATLKLAFDAINAGTHTGVILIQIASNTTETAAPCVLNSNAATPASYTSVLIRPKVDGVTISGATVTGRGLIELNGADNVTIEGDNPNTAGTNRNFTLTNTAAITVTYTSVIRIALNITDVVSADNNTFKNLNINGSATGLNIATAISTTGPENTTYGILAGANAAGALLAPTAISSISTTIGSPAVANNFTVTNNSITSASRGLTVQGSATTVFPGLLINKNTIGNPTSGAVDGIYAIGIAANGSANAVISGNTINVEGWIPSSSSNTAIQVGTIGGAINGAVIEKNKINRVKSNALTGFNAWGINLATGNNHIVRNNFVQGIINVPNATFSTTFGAHGIRVLAGTGHLIYHNTVNMTGDLTGSANAALTSALCIVSTTPTGMDIRNNILYNSQTQTGAATPASSAFVSLYLPSTASIAMNLTLNNNNYFTGAAVNNGVGQAGTTAGTNFFTLALFDPTITTPAGNMRAFTNPLTAALTNDNASKKVDPLFVSATDLHILSASPMESMGATVAVSDDIDGDARGGTPDIGADEITLAGSGTLQFSSATYAGNEGTTATITVVRSGGITGALAVNYATSNGTAIGGASCTGATDYLSNSGTLNWANGDAASKTFTVSLCSDLILDPAETVNLTLSNVVGTTITGTNPAVLTIANIAPPLNGTYTVGSGGNYPSLTNAGGIFEALNLSGATGNVTINIISDVSGELGTNALNEIVGGYKVAIQPFGAARTVTGNSAGALIKINGADSVTINGSTIGATVASCLVGGNAAIRELTIQNTNTGTSAVVLAVQTGTNGAKYNVIKNVNILGQDPLTTLLGISLGGNNPGTAGADNDSNRVENCSIKRTIFGIYSAGANAANINIYTVIQQNDISATGADRVRRLGILIFNDTATQITYNSIGGISSDESNDAVGIGLGTQGIDASSVATGAIVGALVSHNKINGVVSTNTGGYSAAGIAVAGGVTGGINTIANNMITGVISPATSPDLVAGIHVAGAAGSNTRLYHNSVSMTGNRGAVAAQMASYGIAITGVDPVVELKNNIFYNTQEPGSGGVNAKNYAIGMVSTTFVNLNSDYNNFWTTGTQDGGFRSGSLQSGAGTDYATIALWSTATAKDANSVEALPPFVSDLNDLHLTPSASCATIAKGVNLPAVTTDFDCNSRNTLPFMGAHEAYEPATVATTLETISGTSRTYLISGATQFLSNCKLIAAVTPNGASLISGSTTARVWIEAAQPVQFVRRHYEINASSNVNTATGSVTLYFRDAEFNAFNTQAPPPALLLPISTDPGTIAARKANLRVEKRGGISSDNTGLPASYGGAITTIDPVDADIIWNAASSRWEVTFDVTGFSGFFVKTISAALPIKWLSITGNVNALGFAAISWKVQEQKVASYELQKSMDAASFTTIAIINSKGDGINDYVSTDNMLLQAVSYFRIKQVDKDGRISYSSIVKLSNKQYTGIGLYPNPAKDIVTVTVGQTLLNTRLQLTDVNGRVLQQIKIANATFTINVEPYAAGIYLLKTENGKAVKIVKQ